jgi:error-prone DNA polymerase
VYIELHASSAFSFLDGASLPETLIERAAALGYPAIALLDRDGVYGAPQFYRAAKAAGIKAIVGAELTIDQGSGPRPQASGTGTASGCLRCPRQCLVPQPCSAVGSRPRRRLTTAKPVPHHHARSCARRKAVVARSTT